MRPTCQMCGYPKGMGVLEVTHHLGQHLREVITCPQCQAYRDASYRLIDHLKRNKETPDE